MSKEKEIEKLNKAMITENFEASCEEQGFTINHSAEENKSKKKANL